MRSRWLDNLRAALDVTPRRRSAHVRKNRRAAFERLEDRLVFALTVNIPLTSMAESGGVAAATVTRTGSTSTPLTVSLSSSDATEATVPPTVIIPAGSASVAFQVTAVDDLVLDDRAAITITASAAGHTSAGDAIDVVNDDRAALRPAVSAASDVINVAPRTQAGEYDVTAGPIVAPGVRGLSNAAFVAKNYYQTAGANQAVQSDAFIPVDVSKTYALSGWAKSGDEFGERYQSGNLQSFGYASYDSDYQPILPQHVLRFGTAADTTLAVALHPGDTTIQLTSAANWSNAAGAAAGTRGLAWYGYKDSAGTTYANYTYTRNVALGGANGLWSAGGVNGNVITLSAPWNGPTLAAGVAVRNTGVGSEVTYAALDSQSVPGDWSWTQYSAMVGGQVLQNGNDSLTQFRPGTAYIKPAILANKQGGNANFVSWRDVTVTPVAAGTTPAQLALPVVDLTTITAGDQRQSLPAPVGNTFAWSASLVRVNTSERYTLAARAINASQVDERPMGFVSLDVDKKLIHPLHVAKYDFAADTTLAASLSPGDTSFLIANASGWSTDAWESADTRSLAWYGYTDSTGHTYANYTYTRNVAYDLDDGLWDPGAIQYDAGAGAYRVTLRQAWSGPSVAAGTAVRNAASGEAYNQPSVSVGLDSILVSNWSDYAATIGGGVWQNGQPSDTAFRPGTVIIQPIFTSTLWTDVVIGPEQDAIYGGPLDPTRQVLQAGVNRQIAIDLDVLAKGALGGGAAVVIQSVDAPRFGAATIVAGAGPGGRAIINYRSPSWFVGTDVVTYTLRNTNTNELLTASVTIHVLGGNFQQTASLVTALNAQSQVAGNPAPITRDDIYRAVAGQPLVVDVLAGPGVLGNDTDGTDVNVARLIEGPANGSLSLNADGSFTYTPAAGFSGIDTFVYEAFDGINASRETAQISVSLTTAGLSASRLRDISLGILNYESAKGRMPVLYSSAVANQFDASGNPYLSWRVHILPYLGYDDLYAKFRLNEPWNSANNLPLANRIPEVFRDSAASVGATSTRLQIISGEGTQYYWRRSGANLIGPRLSDFTDGAQNTLLVVEVGADQANIWSKPDDRDFSVNNPLAALGAISPRGINAVMADGSTITLSPTISAATFKSLVTIAGGEVVDAGTLRRQFAETHGGAAAVQTFGALAGESYFKQIALGMLNHVSAKGYFPVGGLADANGDPLLSWRVHILPFMGYSALYSKFKLDEPWNSSNNLPLLAEMPDVFRSAGDGSTTTSTRVVTFYGIGSPFYPSVPDQIGRGITQAAIRDGTESTIMFFEAGAEAAEPWTKPKGVPLVIANPLSNAGTFPSGEIRAATFDSTRLTLPADLPASVISALATHAGNEVVDPATIVAREYQRAGYYDHGTAAISKLKNVVLGMLNYESARAFWPSNSFSATGQPLLSWRVRILPYMGYQSLYDKFKLNEPWDSANNLPLLNEMPDIFRTSGDAADSSTTRVLEFTGPGAPFPASGTNTTTGPRVNQFTDGTSNTFAFIEAGRERDVPWTKPVDLPFHKNNPFSPLGDMGPVLLPAFADGSIRGQLASMSLSQLAAFITHNGNDNTTPPPDVPNVPGFYIHQSAGDTSLSEFGVDAFDVVLDKAPLTNVVLTLAVSNAGIATLDRQSVTFTPANWNVPQRVALRGVDNHAVNTHRTVDVTVAVAASLSDDAYDALPPQSFVATIRDDLRQFSADFTTDAKIDGLDFLQWQRHSGAASASPSDGDADLDGDVDPDDLARWHAQVGATNVSADFNRDGNVGALDLAAWRGGFAGAIADRGHGDSDADGDVDGRDFLTWQRTAQAGTPVVASVVVADEAFVAAAMQSDDAVTQPGADLAFDAPALAAAWHLQNAKGPTTARGSNAALKAPAMTPLHRVPTVDGVRDRYFASHAEATAPQVGVHVDAAADRALPGDDSPWAGVCDRALARSFRATAKDA